MLITYLISSKGVSRGIEKFNKIVIPILFLLLIYIFLKTKPWNINNTSALFKTSFEHINFKDLLHIFSSAGEQMFFSLSIAVGTMVTYGTYMNQKQDTLHSAFAVVVADSFVAVLAGLSIISASVSYNANGGLSNGIGLLFITMQNLIFGEVGFVFGIAFYLLVILAALSSAVAFVEVPLLCANAYGITDRKTGALLCCSIISVFSIVVSCDGFRNNIMDIWIFIAEGIIIPVTALISTIYIGWVYGAENLIKYKNNTTLKKLVVSHIFRFFAPIVIIIVIIGQIIGFVK
jgi:NSS family neurotransmitter:Na+ symporter